MQLGMGYSMPLRRVMVRVELAWACNVSWGRMEMGTSNTG